MRRGFVLESPPAGNPPTSRMLAGKLHEGPAPSPRTVSYAYPGMSSLRSVEKSFQLPIRQTEIEAASMVQDAPNRVLHIPELLENILECCSLSTLVSCARVNHDWFRLAVKVLWRGDTSSWEFDTASMPYASSLVPYPSIWQLDTLAPERLGFYLEHSRAFLCHTHNCNDTRVLHPDWDHQAWAAFRGKALRLDSDTAWKFSLKDEGYLRLLHPQLRILQCPRSWTAKCTPILKALQTQCPRLTWLQIRLPTLSSEPTAIPAFVATLSQLSSSLRALQITFENRQPSDILPAIFALPRLEFLSFEEFGPDTHSIPYLSWLPEFERSFTPPPLRHLRAHVSYEALPHYLSRFPLLEDIELLFPSPADFRPEAVALALSHCPKLTSLNIQIHPESFISPASLLQIAIQHPRLRELLVHCGKEGRLPYLTPWPAGTLAQLCALLPRLDKLRLEYHMDVDPNELISLARSCPLLRELRLSADLVLKPLAAQATENPPLFANLEILRVDHLLYSRKHVRTEVLRVRLEDVVRRHMPRVHTLGNFGPDAHDYDEIELGRRGTKGLDLPGRSRMEPPKRIASVGDAIWTSIWGKGQRRWTSARSSDDGYISYGSRS